MFQIPGVTYYQTTSAVLGKIYSNTMMMNIVNGRMAYNITNLKDTDTQVASVLPPNELLTDNQFSASNGGISVTREEWRDEGSLSPGQGANGPSTIAEKHPLPVDSDTNA